MGHRHMLNLPQILETDGGQEWNHPDQPYMPITMVGASGSSPLVHPTVNIRGEPIPSSFPTPNRHQWSIVNAESAHNETEATGPPHLPFLHKPADRTSRLVPNNYLHTPSPSSLSRQTAPTVAESFHNQTMGSASQKRKNPWIPEMYEMGPTSRYYNVGSSSNLHLPAGSYEQKQNLESHPTPWMYPPGYVLDSLSIGGEGTPRNVRSRGNVDREPNAVWASSSNFQNLPFSSQSSDQTNSLGFSRQSSSTPTMGLSGLISRAGSGVVIGSGTSSSVHDPNTLGTLNGHGNVSVETGGFSNSGTLNRNTIPQISNSNVNQSFGGVQSGYSQRTVPTFGDSSSNFRAVHVTTPNEGLPIAAESNSSRYRQVFSAVRLLNRERNLRIGMPSNRFRSSGQEGRLVVDRSALYGPNNPFDQHRDMRLDVDNMSYEELLVLGERIGSVNTGLSDALISKCLTESILCSSDQSEGDGRCVICLEEYQDMDDLGNLKCRHDFHVGCIRKWLSMKNLCPICKTAAMDENKKEE